MLIGNRHEFAIELVPASPSWSSKYRPEQAVWAGFALWLCDTNLSLHVVDGTSTTEEYLYVPLAALADWLVASAPAISFEERPKRFSITQTLHRDAARWADVKPPRGMTEDDWLDERERWWSSHFLRAGADGAIVPDVALSRDDDRLVVSWHLRPSRRAMISFLHEAGTTTVNWSSAVDVISAFVAYVAESLREAGLGDLYAWASEADPWMSALQDQRRGFRLFIGQPAEHLEQLLGVATEDELFRALGLTDAWDDPAESIECQILRDLSPNISRDILESVRALGEVIRTTQPNGKGWLVSRDVAREAMRSATSPEEAGQLAAGELRKWLQLGFEPIVDTDALLQDIGVRVQHGVEGGTDEMIVGTRENSSPVVHTFRSLRTRTRWGRRFEACRALGHLACDAIRTGGIGAASGPFAPGMRRRRSGAFAAELLLPSGAIAARSGGMLDGLTDETSFSHLLEDYGVGARTAAYQLWNQGWLSTGAIRDELIDVFAARDIRD